jgi:hypothetical protein
MNGTLFKILTDRYVSPTQNIISNKISKSGKISTGVVGGLLSDGESYPD